MNGVIAEIDDDVSSDSGYSGFHYPPLGDYAIPSAGEPQLEAVDESMENTDLVSTYHSIFDTPIHIIQVDGHVLAQHG